MGIEEMLIGFTINGAKQLGIDDRKGSITAGKDADFLVFNNDLLTAEHEGFRIIDENLGAEQYGIAFRSGDAELCAQIEGAVAALVENGTYAKIAEKYPDIVNNLLFLS